MSQTHILIATGIYPPSVGGPATYSKLLFDELPKRGIDVSVVTFDVVRKYPKIIRHILFLFLIIKNARGVSHIYAQDPVSVGLPAWLASTILRKSFMIRVAGDYAWEQGTQRFAVKDTIDEFQSKKYGFSVEILRKVQTFVVSRAKVVIVPSDYFKRLVGAWNKNTVVHRIYNGIELPNITTSKKEMRDSLDRSPDEVVLVSAGRLVPWKGFKELIQVVSVLEKEIQKKISLYILGDGPEMDILRTEVAELRAGSTIELVGSVSREKMFDYLIASDIFVLNTSFESFSFQIVEAMHSGLPVVTNAVGSLPELIEDGRDGFLINKKQDNALAKAIRVLVEDGSKREKFGASGKQKAKNFSIDATVSAFTQLLQKI